MAVIFPIGAVDGTEISDPTTGRWWRYTAAVNAWEEIDKSHMLRLEDLVDTAVTGAAEGSVPTWRNADQLWHAELPGAVGAARPIRAIGKGNEALTTCESVLINLTPEVGNTLVLPDVAAPGEYVEVYMAHGSWPNQVDQILTIVSNANDINRYPGGFQVDTPSQRKITFIRHEFNGVFSWYVNVNEGGKFWSDNSFPINDPLIPENRFYTGDFFWHEFEKRLYVATAETPTTWPFTDWQPVTPGFARQSATPASNVEIVNNAWTASGLLINANASGTNVLADFEFPITVDHPADATDNLVIKARIKVNGVVTGRAEIKVAEVLPQQGTYDIVCHIHEVLPTVTRLQNIVLELYRTSPHPLTYVEMTSGATILGQPNPLALITLS